MAICVLALIVAFDVLLPAFPAPCWPWSGAIAASALFHWGSHGIKLVGDVPQGLPALGLPHGRLGTMFRWFCPSPSRAASSSWPKAPPLSRAYAFRYGERFSEETGSRGPLPRQFRGRTERHVRRQWQPHQNGHGRYGGRSQPDRASHHRGDGAPGSAVPDEAAELLAQCGARRHRVSDRRETDRSSRPRRNPPERAGTNIVVALAIAAIVLFIGVKARQSWR